MCCTDLAADSAQLLGSQTPLTMVTSVISFDFVLSFKVSSDWIMFNCCLNRKGQKGINKPAAFIWTHVITLCLMEQKRVHPPGVALITDYQTTTVSFDIQVNDDCNHSQWRPEPDISQCFEEHGRGIMKSCVPYECYSYSIVMTTLDWTTID